MGSVPSTALSQLVEEAEQSRAVVEQGDVTEVLPGEKWQVELCAGDGRCLIYALYVDKGKVNGALVRKKWAKSLENHLCTPLSRCTGQTA